MSNNNHNNRNNYKLPCEKIAKKQIMSQTLQILDYQQTTRKAQLTQMETRNSGACLKAH